MKDGILATLHEKVDFDMLKGVVHEKYEFSEENNQLAVFWLDQMFDYDVSPVYLLCFVKGCELRKSIGNCTKMVDDQYQCTCFVSFYFQNGFYTGNNLALIRSHITMAAFALG